MTSIRKILLPLLDPTRALPYVRMAEALLPADGKILALKIVEIPEAESLSVGAEKAPIYRAALEDFRSQFSDPRVEFKSLVRVSYGVKDGIAQAASDEGCDLLLLPWKGYSTSEERFFGATIDKLLENPPCNILIVRGGELATCKRILLPIRGGPYAELALEISSRLARALDAEVTVLHCESDGASRDLGDRTYRSFVSMLGRYPDINRLVTFHGKAAAGIMREAKSHDMIIVGASYKPAAPADFFGPIVEDVAGETDKPLLVVKTPSTTWAEFGADSPTPPGISEKVDKWFAENTFHRREFDDFARLVELKQKQQVSISLGLPALNEAETVGKIIATIKENLMTEVPLLDEIVLIDSRSTDNTRAIAQDLGIDTYIHQEILPQYGAYRGKGEALWKSLYVLKGDIIVWIDTDIKNIHPGFVYGVLGPLLNEPEIQYVKGLYRRPLRAEGKVYSEGGGRVTELTARPFFNLFFPELSGIIQPLAGEYAGRRHALEQVPFFTGYGVETGLLIDLFARHGLRGLAQVDLEERVHRNQSLPALSQMSFAIIQVFMQRLQEKNRIQLLEEVNQSMKLIKSRGRTYALEVKEIREHERPPMITLPEYRARREEICRHQP